MNHRNGTETKPRSHLAVLSRKLKLHFLGYTWGFYSNKEQIPCRTLNLGNWEREARPPKENLGPGGSLSPRHEKEQLRPPGSGVMEQVTVRWPEEVTELLRWVPVSACPGPVVLVTDPKCLPAKLLKQKSGNRHMFFQCPNLHLPTCSVIFLLRNDHFILMEQVIEDFRSSDPKLGLSIFCKMSLGAKITGPLTRRMSLKHKPMGARDTIFKSSPSVAFV